MKQEPNKPEEVAQGTADSEVELLLDDAYDMPAVPRSLLKRLDQAIEQEWGVSPKLAQRPATRLVHGGPGVSRALKAWSIAGGVALMVASLALLQNDAHAFTWAKMVEALGQMEGVEFATDDGLTTRWLSLKNAIVGERSSGKSRLFDFERGVLLERDIGSDRARRYDFTSATSASRSEAMLIAFLLDNVGIEGGAARQTDVSVLAERWSRGDSDDVMLEVQIGSPEESSRLIIVIDSKTHLPRSVGVAGATSAAFQLVPSGSGSRFQSEEFPANLLVVEATPSEAAVASDSPTAGGQSSVNTLLGASVPSPEEKVELVGAATLQWPAVEPTKLSSKDAVAQINATLESLWAANSIEPAGTAGDDELLRRTYLDLTGRTPSVSEVREYLSDKSDDRYVKLVDRLLASRDFATHMATVWRTYLIPEGIDLARFGGTQSFEKWMGQQFEDEVPYDEIVRQLLLAEGRLTQAGPLVFYAAVKLDPDLLAKQSARVFLGMRLDCAQCHDDHFEPWLQEDFWGYAAFFAQISRPQAVLQNVSTVMRVHDVERGDVKLPDSDVVVQPRFLDGSPIDNDETSIARRKKLATWLTAAENPYFARATVNRVWGQLFGKGIVDPVDGFGTQHEPVSQELLDQLAAQFIGSNYDLRDLIRTITRSRAYRLSSGAGAPDPKRRELFAQMNVKLLTAEQMYDCITVASMLVSAEADSGFNIARVGNESRDQFLQQFRAPPGRSTEYQAGIPQALTLMNGGLIGNATGLSSSGLLESLKVPFIKNRERIEILYLATLSRQPTASELELLSDYIREDTTGDELYESLADVLWALLNSAEFTMNH